MGGAPYAHRPNTHWRAGRSRMVPNEWGSLRDRAERNDGAREMETG
jgi:hypothetical protein